MVKALPDVDKPKTRAQMGAKDCHTKHHAPKPQALLIIAVKRGFQCAERAKFPQPRRKAQDNASQ